MSSQDLIGRYMAGQCSDAETRALQEALKSDPALRRAYLDHLNLETALEARAEWALATHAPPRENTPLMDLGPQRPRRSLLPNSLLRAAAGVCLSFCGWWLWKHVSPPCATVVACPGVRHLSPRSTLRKALCEVPEGSIELRTPLGARMVIEAPAVFQFESPSRLRLHQGRLSANIPPPARGFTVVTASGEAVDLGTRFGVDVSDSGPAEVHVFEGEVREKALGGVRQQPVRGGEAVTMDHGAGKPRDLRTSAFIQPEEIAPLQAALSAGQATSAARALDTLRQDPALITLLDFESTPPGPGHYRVVQGRWPGSKALEFRDVGHHFQLHAGGGKKWPQLTLATWVRLDRVGGGRIQSLFHTNGWDRRNPGQIHWSITTHGTLWLVCLPFQKQPVHEENTPHLPIQSRWVHLASSYDSERHILRHYLDGTLGLEMPLTETAPAVLGDAQIGNWDQYDRNLTGRVDEFLLMGRILTPEEILALYRSGTPYRDQSDSLPRR